MVHTLNFVLKILQYHGNLFIYLLQRKISILFCYCRPCTVLLLFIIVYGKLNFVREFVRVLIMCIFKLRDNQILQT